jgi:hypothetical protein
MFEDIGFIAAVVAAGIGVLWLVASRRGRPKSPTLEDLTAIVKDWAPSGKIDFSFPDETNATEPAIFALRIEEIRLRQSVSGARLAEVRWRNATMQEAKRVVSHCNADHPANEHDRPFQSISIVPDTAVATDKPNIEPVGATGTQAKSRAGSGAFI